MKIIHKYKLYFSGFCRETAAKEFGFKQIKIYFKELACVIMEAEKLNLQFRFKGPKAETQGNSLCCSLNQSASLSTEFLSCSGRLFFPSF